MLLNSDVAWGYSGRRISAARNTALGQEIVEKVIEVREP